MSSTERRHAEARRERQRQTENEARVRARRRKSRLWAAAITVAILGGVGAYAVARADNDPKRDTITPGALSCEPAPKPKASPESFKGFSSEPAKTVVLDTNCGKISADLLPDVAPKAVESFTFLVSHDFYDETPCHRVTTEGIFVLQCGDPTGTGSGTPGYTIPFERQAVPAKGIYAAGTLAMARSTDVDTAGSQFFIVYKETSLPGDGYVVFGRVTSGLDIVTRVAAAGSNNSFGPGDGNPNQKIGIVSANTGEN